MFLRNNLEVYFSQYNSINSLLGFHSKLYTSGFHESEKFVNILTINSMLVNIYIISGSYVNGSTTTYNLLVLSRCPHNLLYLPINSDTIHSITVWLTDQNGNVLNIRGENLSMRFHFREILKNLEFLK